MKKALSLMAGLALATAALAAQAAPFENKSILKEATAEARVLIAKDIHLIAPTSSQSPGLQLSEVAKPAAAAKPDVKVYTTDETRVARAEQKAYKEFNGRTSVIVLGIDRGKTKLVNRATVLGLVEGADNFYMVNVNTVTGGARIASPDLLAMEGGLGALRIGHFNAIGGGSSNCQASAFSLVGAGTSSKTNKSGASVS